MDVRVYIQLEGEGQKFPQSSIHIAVDDSDDKLVHDLISAVFCVLGDAKQGHGGEQQHVYNERGDTTHRDPFLDPPWAGDPFTPPRPRRDLAAAYWYTGGHMNPTYRALMLRLRSRLVDKVQGLCSKAGVSAVFQCPAPNWPPLD